MLHGPRPDHVQVDVQKAAPKMAAALDSRRVEAIAPERTVAPPRQVVVLGDLPVDKLQRLGDLRRAAITTGQQQVGVIRGHHPRKDTYVEPLRCLEQVQTIHPPVLLEAEPVLPVVTAVRDMVTRLPLPVTTSARHQRTPSCLRELDHFSLAREMPLTYHKYTISSITATPSETATVSDPYPLAAPSDDVCEASADPFMPEGVRSLFACTRNASNIP